MSRTVCSAALRGRTTSGRASTTTTFSYPSNPTSTDAAGRARRLRRDPALLVRSWSCRPPRGKAWSSRLLSAGRRVAPCVLDRRALADHQVDSAPEHALARLAVDVCGVADGAFAPSRVQEA